MRSAILILVAFITACANDPKPIAKAPLRPVGKTFTPIVVVTPPKKIDRVTTPNVSVSGEIAELCGVTTSELFSQVSAPKFDFDDATLTGADRDILDQIARCMLSGPLATRSIRLTGRADPRGEEEYNMALGARRAGSAHQYLRDIGVSPMRMNETSRGELDATGVDEPSWARDRRVDITLI